jgi:LuxR family transcriptional regulator, maltose regulon positive regulatory protein
MRQPLLSGAVPRPVSAEISRHHLLPLLETETPVVVLIAPSGYGKTTLLAQYARSAPRPSIWLDLGEDDCQPLWLAQQLSQAVENVEALEWTWKKNTEAKPEVLGRALARDLSGASENLNLMLDRIELLNLEAGAFVTAFAGALTEGHRLFLSGYSAESLRLAQLVAYGHAHVLLTEDLAFRSEESVNYLEARGYTGNATEVLKRLAGWPAGLSLIAAGARPGLSPSDLVLEVCRSLPKAIADHLCELAVVPIWTEHKAKQFGCCLPDGWLETVRRSGLPLSPLGGEAGFVPHQIVLLALEQQLNLVPELYRKFHERAGELALEDGLSLVAVKHFTKAGNLNRAQTAFQPVLELLLWRGEHRVANEFLEQIEADGFSVFPGMRAAVTLGLGNISLAEQMAHTAFSLNPDDAWAAFVFARLAARRGDYAGQLTWAERGLVLADDQASHGVFYRLRRLQLGALLVLKRHAEALNIARADLVQADKRGTLEDIAEANRHVHIALNLSHGDPQENRLHLERSLAAYRTLGAPIRALPLENNLADMLIKSGDLNGAELVIARAVHIAEESDNELLAFLLEMQGHVCRLRGDSEGALTAYATARQLAERFELQVVWARILLSEVDVLSARGNHLESAAKLAQANMLGVTNMMGLSERLEFTLGCRAFDLEQWAEAQSKLSASLQGHNPVIVARAQWLLLEIESRTNPLNLETKQPRLPPDQSSLGTTPLEFIKMLDRDRLEIQRQAMTPHIKPEQQTQPKIFNVLRIKTFGDFDLWGDNQLARVALSKSQELLVYLALHGPCARDVLIDVLWDGAPIHAHLEYFKTVVRRLRADLAGALPNVPNPLIFDGRRYRLAEELVVDLDVHQLEQALVSNELEEQRLVLAKVGEFLPSVNSYWVEPLRAHYTTWIVELHERFADKLHSNGQLREAIAAYQAALRIEPTSSGALLGLVKLHLLLGDAPTAIREVRHQRLKLQQEYDIDLDVAVLKELRRLDVVEAGA